MEAQENIGVEVAEKLIKYSDNGSSFASVNFPAVTLPAHPGKHRLLHIHKNVPGSHVGKQTNAEADGAREIRNNLDRHH